MFLLTSGNDYRSFPKCHNSSKNEVNVGSSYYFDCNDRYNFMNVPITKMNTQPVKILEIDQKKKETSVILEIIFGLFFIFGIGWFYAGNKVKGSVLIISSILTVSAISSFLLATGGFGVCLCGVPIYLSLIFDVKALRKWLTKPLPEDFKSMMKSGLIFFVIGLSIICIALIIIAIKLPKYFN